MKYVAVIGSRGYDNYDEFCDKILYYTKRFKRDEITFVSGGAKSGADFLIEKFCIDHNMPIIVYHAKWDDIEGKKPHEIGIRGKWNKTLETGVAGTGSKYYKSAGLDRNIKIIAKADFVIAFWDGWSRGTKHSIGLAEGTGKPIRIVKV